MNDKNNKWVFFIIILLITIFVIWVVFLLKSKIQTSKIEKTNTDFKQEVRKFDEKNIPPMPDKIDFNTNNINPNSFPTINDFLKRVKIWTWMDIDLSKEDFVIQNETWSWIYNVFRFRQSYINDKTIFSKKDAKNEAIIDIFDAYKNKSIYRTHDSEKIWSKISYWEELRHPSTMMLNSIFLKQINMYDLIKEYKSRPRLSVNDSDLLAYLYDFDGSYNDAINLRKDNCKKYIQSCDKDIEIIFKWNIKDQDWKNLEGVKVEILNTKDKVITDNQWNYEIKFSYYPFSHIRTKASLLGYSDWFISSSVNSYYLANSYIEINNNFTLNKANSIIDLSKTSTKNWYYEFKTENSLYKVPVDWLYYLNGEKFNWNKLTVYLYEFNKWSKIDNLMEVDTFTPVYWYVGNIMKTFWMPYIQFFDEKSNEVFVKKSNPMILTNQVYHMKELYDNYDKIYEPLTKEDMKKLVNDTKSKWGYPIDMKYLTENNMLRWPARWALDRAKWKWENIGCKVLNEDWLVEIPFYSINDTK